MPAQPAQPLSPSLLVGARAVDQNQGSGQIGADTHRGGVAVRGMLAGAGERAVQGARRSEPPPPTSRVADAQWCRYTACARATSPPTATTAQLARPGHRRPEARTAKRRKTRKAKVTDAASLFGPDSGQGQEEFLELSRVELGVVVVRVDEALLETRGDDREAGFVQGL